MNQDWAKNYPEWHGLAKSLVGFPDDVREQILGRAPTLPQARPSAEAEYER